MKYQGSIFCDYQDLATTFGVPNRMDSTYDKFRKTAQWDIPTKGDPVAVYSFMVDTTGQAFQEISEIKRWHIGGTSAAAVSAVLKALEKSLKDIDHIRVVYATSGAV